MSEPTQRIVVRRGVPGDATPPAGPPASPPPGPLPVGPPATQPGPAAPAPVAAVTVERPHPLTGLAKSWIALFGLIVVFGRDVADRGLDSIAEMGPFMWIVGGVVLLVVLVNFALGIIEWRTTTFVTDEDEFRIDRSFLSRESTRISYAKIQSVDIERSLPARMLGLSSVQIDVGGAGGKKLEFLGRERAEVLRDHLLAHMQGLGPVPDGAAPTTDGAPPLPGTAEGRTVIRVAPSTLLKGTLVSGFLPWLVGAVGFVVVTILVQQQQLTLAAFGGLVFGIGGYLWSQIAKNWNFTLTEVPNGLHVRRGLFTTVSQSLRPDRIQAVAIHQDYLQRLVGLYRVRVTVLGVGGDSEGDGERTSGTVLPYGSWDEVLRVLAAFWPGIDLASIELHGQPARARWLTPLGFHRHQWGVDDQTVVAHHGWMDRTISLVPHRRVQSMGLAQSPLQRLLGLAGVELHTTDGPVTLQLYHLDTAAARAFLDAEVLRAREARAGGATYLSTLPPPVAAPVAPLGAPSAEARPVPPPVAFDPRPPVVGPGQDRPAGEAHGPR